LQLAAAIVLSGDASSQSYHLLNEMDNRKKKDHWHLIRKYVSLQVRSLVSLAQASEEEILAALKVSQVLWDGAPKYDSISTVATFFF